MIGDASIPLNAPCHIIIIPVTKQRAFHAGIESVLPRIRRVHSRIRIVAHVRVAELVDNSCQVTVVVGFGRKETGGWGGVRRIAQHVADDIEVMAPTTQSHCPQALRQLGCAENQLRKTVLWLADPKYPSDWNMMPTLPSNRFIMLCGPWLTEISPPAISLPVSRLAQ